MIIFGTNDAGPAAYLSRIISSLDEINTTTFSSKVSSNVFAKHGINNFLLNDTDSITNTLSTAKLVITGTCLNSGVDKTLVNFARKYSIPSISVIEHWSWYHERFLHNNIYEYPDFIWVNDDVAFQEAISSGVPEELLLSIGNPVLEHVENICLSDIFNQENNIIKKILDNPNNIILISEEIKNDFDWENKIGFNEFTVLDTLRQNLPPSKSIYIKLHPAENKHKYDHLLSDTILLLPKVNNNLSIAKNNNVIGLGSMLLIELSFLSNNVFTYRPNEKSEFIGNKLGVTRNLKLQDIVDSNFSSYMNSADKISYLGSLLKIQNAIKDYL